MINYSKMHGNGNDFVIINSIDSDVLLTKDFIKHIASREDGIGFDQIGRASCRERV